MAVVNRKLELFLQVLKIFNSENSYKGFFHSNRFSESLFLNIEDKKMFSPAATAKPI